MQTPKIINYFLLILVMSYLSSCEVVTVEQSRYVPDTKRIKAEVELMRFDQDFFALDTNQLDQGLTQLKEQYPQFANGYLYSVLRVPEPMLEAQIVKGYLSYKPTQYTYDTIQKVFGNMSDIQKDLNELAVHFEYYNYMNQVPLTKGIAHLCEYSYDRAVGDGFVPLPLDMALGKGYAPYSQIKIPFYQQRTLNRQHLVPKAAFAIAEDMVNTYAKMKAGFMIDFMLMEGKKFYLTDILMPTVADSVKFSFSAYQMEFCQKGELELYQHLTDEEMLYSDEQKNFAKYVNAGPFNPSASLPGNSGTWLGYRMVLAYAEHLRKSLKTTSPNLTAQEIDQKVLRTIIEENDPQKFLQQYKPRK